MKKTLLFVCAAPFRLLLVLAVFSTLLYMPARAQSWAQAERLPAGAPNDNGYAQSTATATDAQGNVYMAGNFYGRVSFGATTLVAAGDEHSADFFVAKVSPSGQWLWVLRAGGAATDYVNDLVLDAQGNAYLAGRLGPDATLGTLTPNTSSAFGNAFVARLSAAGQFEWVTTAGAETATSLALDGSGNVLATGTYFNTAAVFGTTTLPSYGFSDVWVAKLNPTGTQWLWAVRAGSTSNDYVRQIGTDAAGNAYLTGEYGAAATFGSFQLPVGNYNGFVAKISPAGQFAYATRLFSTNNLYANGLVVSPGGDAYVTGSFQGGYMMLGTIRLNNYSSSGSYDDGFVARLNSAGAWQWGIALGGSADESGEGLALDATGNLYATGSFESTTLSLGSTTLPNNGGGYTANAYVGRLDAATGAWVWSAGAGSFDEEAGTRLSTSPAGTVAVTGTYSSLATNFGSTTLSGTALGIYPSVFVAQLNGATGGWNWALGSTGGGDRRVFGTCADAQGNVYVTGTFLGTVTLGSTTLTSTTSGNDIFVAKRTAAGQWLWAVRAGGDAADRGLAVAADAQGNVYVSGYFAQGSFPVSTPKFTAAFGSTTLTSIGSSDLFVAKLDAAGQWLWAVRAGGTGEDAAVALAVDAAGAACLAGNYASSSSLQFGPFTLAGAGVQGGAFAAKLSAAGQWLWASALGTGTGTGNTARGLALDAGGNAYVTGGFSTTKSFGSTSLTSAGSTDIYLAQLDGSTGSPGWAMRAGGTLADEGQAVALDTQGNPHLAATLGSRNATAGSLPLNNAGYGLAVLRLTPAGLLSWSAVTSSTFFGEAAALTLDANGTVYVAGQFQGTLTLGSTVLTSTSTASGSDSRDLVVARLSPAGAWQQAIQSTGGTFGEYATGLALSAGGQLFVAGYTYSSAVSFGATTLPGYSTYPMGFLAQAGSFLTAVQRPQAGSGLTAQLYPNPARGLITLRMPAGAPLAPLTLTNAQGRVVRHYPRPTGPEATLDLRGLPAGLYLVRGAGPVQRLLVE